MSAEFRDTTDLMVYGHEGWLEPSVTHIHEGDTVQLYFNWGHNMVSDGLARKDGLSAFFVSPDGQQQDLPVSGQKDNCYVFNVVPEAPGVYHFVCKYVGSYVVDQEGSYHIGNLKDFPDAKSASLYTQFSHLALRVGHGVPENQSDTMPDLDLRLIPEEWKNLQIGDEIIFNLQQGLRPLGKTKVTMTHAPENGGDVNYQIFETDDQGNFNVKIEGPGRYLLIARHHMPDTESDLYTDESLTTTCFFPVKG